MALPVELLLLIDFGWPEGEHWRVCLNRLLMRKVSPGMSSLSLFAGDIVEIGLVLVEAHKFCVRSSFR